MTLIPRVEFMKIMDGHDEFWNGKDEATEVEVRAYTEAHTDYVSSVDNVLKLVSNLLSDDVRAYVAHLRALAAALSNPSARQAVMAEADDIDALIDGQRPACRP